MASINKLLDKVNQATSAVKSLKGIKSKLEGKSYKGTYDKDMLASEKAKAEKLLDDRRSSLQANLDASNQARQSATHILSLQLDQERNEKEQKVMKVIIKTYCQVRMLQSHYMHPKV